MKITSEPPILVWFRQDLRCTDNPALVAAAATGRPVVPIFILDEETPGRWRPGAAGRWWLHHSLACLAQSLGALAGRRADDFALVLRTGPSERTLRDVIADTGAASVFSNRCYEPYAIDRDKRIMEALGRNGIEVRRFNASLLFEPWTVETAQRSPYRAFTPFYRASLTREVLPPQPTPQHLLIPAKLPARDRLEDLRLLPKPDWAGGLRAAWTPGERGAQARLSAFLDATSEAYKEKRDRPDVNSTSRLSPHLHFGEIGPRQVWHAVLMRQAASGVQIDGGAFLRQLIWREFSYHLLYHFPNLPEHPMRAEFERVRWREAPDDLAAWQRGCTGYPIVDAGMRELWATGWMHNRVRMIAASFLVKDLLLSWQSGEDWFWDTLVDADLANNAASWQWVAGCGADSAPYFRIFNPVLQGRRFDPEGAYVGCWISAVAPLPAVYQHAPWEAPQAVLDDAEIELGRDYPRPIVDHVAARLRALEAFKRVSK